MANLLNKSQFWLFLLCVLLHTLCASASPNKAVDFSPIEERSPLILPRDADCDDNHECSDKSCCNGETKKCGRDPDHCKAGVCISNCDAKAECGVGALDTEAPCPLNVCCGKWGYCGVTEDFCGDGCQSNCNQPGATGKSGADVRKLVIGYWEGWSLTTRSCRKRTIDDVPVDSLTHLNLAFAYIDSNFEIFPMPGMGGDVMSQITNLKQKAPGLQIWISLGGWTFSDNGTDTQPVWGSLASSLENRQKFANNLLQFMKQWGFDGVDLDWEYPGAGDRGGHPADTQNFVQLLEVLHYVLTLGNDLGLSFTAPTSYWYLRHFAIDQMHQYVSWINLMTYDLHGSWDSPEDYIGSYVFAHTNLTEIKSALDLFWRMDVPANKINLGLGFYGRSFTLESLDCIDPGCPFSGPGVAGSCTGTPGILSYAEIVGMQKMYNLVSVWDKGNAIKWMAWDDDQWVSYDDPTTLQQKVDFANEQGLLGLFIWAIDLDTTDHTALQAVLGGKLGGFADQNGVTGDPSHGNYTSVTGNKCIWSTSDARTCPPRYLSLIGAAQYVGVDDDGLPLEQYLCCPLDSTPDPDTCHWSAGSDTGLGFSCYGACEDDEVIVASSTEPVINGDHRSCFFGFAQFCCKGSNPAKKVCEWNTECTEIDDDWHPKDDGICGDRDIITTAQGSCSKGHANTLCCDKDIDTSSCYWNDDTKSNPAGRCLHVDTCANPDDTRVGLDKNAGFDKNGDSHVCVPAPPCTNSAGCRAPPARDMAFCCNAAALAAKSDDLGTFNLPVPLENLFPKPGPDSNDNKYDVQVDQTMGGNKLTGNTVDPNASGFGFYIMSGPEEEITTLHKRDGSHWDLFDCDDSVGEQRQTVKAVCTDDTENSNCHTLFKGGVPRTILEMPEGCGPGKYAVAVGMEESRDHSHLQGDLLRRGLGHATVFDLTFDYDFAQFQKRADSNVLLRIDYSDDPGYWQSIVADKPSARKRSLELEHGDDHYKIMEALWHIEKRSLPMEELHKRWWSGSVREWIDRHKKIDIEYTGIRHTVEKTFDVTIFNEDLRCPAFGTDIFDELYFKSWATLSLKLEAAAGVTLIGRLDDLSSWDESHAWFRASGGADATLNFQAKGKLSFHTGPVEAFNIGNFGATFRVPGIVTIGPNLRVIAELSGEATLQFDAKYAISFPGFDYSMRYPAAEVTEEIPAGNHDEPKESASHEPFSWDFDAKGELKASIKPLVEFGIVFDSDQLADASLQLGVNSYTRLYGSAHIGSNDALSYCYGMDGGATLYGQVTAPKLFDVNLDRYWALLQYDVDIIPETCGP